MWTMNRRQFMRWEKLRLNGKRLVVLRTAAFATIGLFVFINLLFWLITGNPVSTNFFFLFPALGIAIGLIAWSLNESRFADFLEKKKAAAASVKKRK
jgi:hypothetical protein